MSPSEHAWTIPCTVLADIKAWRNELSLSSGSGRHYFIQWLVISSITAKNNDVRIMLSLVLGCIASDATRTTMTNISSINISELQKYQNKVKKWKTAFYTIPPLVVMLPKTLGYFLSVAQFHLLLLNCEPHSSIPVFKPLLNAFLKLPRVAWLAHSWWHSGSGGS